MTFAYHHPNHYKKLKPRKSLNVFGTTVTIDHSKDLKDQPWFQTDLFNDRQKDAIMTAWNLPGIKPNQRIEKIEEIAKTEEFMKIEEDLMFEKEQDRGK